MEDPRDARRQIQEGKWRRPTAFLAPGYVQANLVVLPRELAYHPESLTIPVTS